VCGILGIVGAKGDIARGLNLMRRRGPDDRGIWQDANVALGHLRLSIIDPSPAGHQPMSSPDGRVVMVYNGEIYNFKELRAELENVGETFSGHTDSEVLLRMFARSGADCFSRLNGIFAAAFWERDTSTLTLVRDPLGVKPLYYMAGNSGSIAFASEMKALLRTADAPPTVDAAALLAHLTYLWSPGSRTIASGVSKLLPGNVLRQRLGQPPTFWCYRDTAPPPGAPDPISETDGALLVARTIDRAVERQMVADVPLGSFLSGGLDSSAVVAFASRHCAPRRLQCFSIELEGDAASREGFADDLPYARRVADHLDVDLHLVKAGAGMADRLAEMVYLLDEPTADPAAINSLMISELAQSQGIKVLLSGSGGDDVFSGYRRHLALSAERWWSGFPAPLRRAAQLAAARSKGIALRRA
jgi:asparagine synthase (glutamine-hydrolysing)